MNLREKFFKNSEEEIDKLLMKPAICNSNSKSSIITFNYKIEDSEIYQVMKPFTNISKLKKMRFFI